MLAIISSVILSPTAFSPIASAAAATTGLAPPPLQSFVGEGVSFFNNMRTPAALVAAAAMKDAFALQAAPEDVRKSRAWTMLRECYLLLQLLAFATEVSCIFVATHAIVSLQMSAGVSDIGTTTSLIALMKTRFEFQYVTVRATFMTGLLAFTTAQALRVRLATRKLKELSWAAMWFLLSSVGALLAYNNSQSITYGGYTGLVVKWAMMTWELLASLAAKANPVAVLALGSFALGLVCAARALCKIFFEAADFNDDGILELADFRRLCAWLKGRLLGLTGFDESKSGTASEEADDAGTA
jgi:hypothetical protein